MKLNVTVQFANSRPHGRLGVPHARSLTKWAAAAAAQEDTLAKTQSSPRGMQLRRPAGNATADLTIRVVGAAESRRLNRTWRGKDKPTNVLSFPSAALDAPLPRASRGRAGRGRSALADGRRPMAGSPLPLGDLAICAPVVAREAREQGKPATAHWAHMVIHGVLHLLGYDHENDRDADLMETRERKLLERFGYPDPYA